MWASAARTRPAASTSCTGSDASVRRSAADADGETLRPREAEHGRHALGDLVQRVVDGPHQLHETKRGIQFGIGHGGTLLYATADVTFPGKPAPRFGY